MPPKAVTRSATNPAGPVTHAFSPRSPAAVAVAPDGDVYVADDTTVRDATTNTLVAGPDATTVWDRPGGLGFGPEGTLYVSEQRPSISILERTGKVLARFDTPGAGHGYEFNLALIAVLASLILTGPGALSIDRSKAQEAETDAAARARLRSGAV